MGKIWIVARHEFAVASSRLGYRIFIASVPTLALAGLIIAAILQVAQTDAGQDRSPAPEPLGYVDLTAGSGGGEPHFTRFHSQGNVAFTRYPDRQTAAGALLSDEIERLFIFPGDYVTSGVVEEVRLAGTLRLDTARHNEALHRFILENLASIHLEQEQLERVINPYRLVVSEVTASGAPADENPTGAERGFFVVVIGLFLMSSVTSSGYLLQGLVEEKESRVMEVLLSALTAEQLILGKLIGLGAASLLQLAVWAASVAGSLLVISRIRELPITVTDLPAAEWLLVACAYFFLGYVFIGTILAAIGAVTTNHQQAGNITALVLFPIMAPLWAVAILIEDPESPIVRTLSFIPFTAPVASLMRLGLGSSMGGLEILASITVLCVSVAIVMWLTVRLLRAYLLTYSHPPSPMALLRTLRGG